MQENIIGYRIKLLREKSKLSQAKLATALGDVKQPVLARYELGSIMPSYPVLVKIADYFDVSADYLLGRSTDVSIDVSELSEEQVAHISLLVNDIKKLNLKK